VSRGGGLNYETTEYEGGNIMTEPEGAIIVGVLGQWASGKSTAAKTLINHLGGENEVLFITDRELLAVQAVNHMLRLDNSKVMLTVEDDGRQRLDGDSVTVWLGPGESLKTVDLNTLRFDLPDDVLPACLQRARVELGYQICDCSAQGKPIVIEAGFGKIQTRTMANVFSDCRPANVMHVAQTMSRPNCWAAVKSRE
jgi:hypothetical protein